MYERSEPTSRLLAVARLVLTRHGALVGAADPDASVGMRSRILCAALAELATSSYRALGGRTRTSDVACAAGLLSLLTKIDDQVIDSHAFHGGAGTDRAELEARCRAFLAPTLRSIEDARAHEASARCALAAGLGRALRELGGPPARLERLLEVIARGWEVQVRAVCTLSAHPDRVSRAEVERVTRDISGAWLLMITMVGTLATDASRAMSADEEAAFDGWGAWIQRTDALSDLAKDLDEGLISTISVHHLIADRARAVVVRAALEARDPGPLYRLLADDGVDLDLMPPAGTLDALEARVEALGEVGPLLSWIHGLLTWRYLCDPRSAREPGDAGFAPYVRHHERWAEYLRAVGAERGERDTPCSAH